MNIRLFGNKKYDLSLVKHGLFGRDKEQSIIDYNREITPEELMKLIGQVNHKIEVLQDNANTIK
jgi:hypothetical protein